MTNTITRPTRKGTPLLPAAGLRLVAILSFASTSWAQVAPSLGTAAPFGIVSGTYTNTVGATPIITGDICFTTGPAFAPTLIGASSTPCAPATGADQLAALVILNGQPCTLLPAGNLDAVVIGANPPGTIPPGCYFRAGAIDITASGTVTLSGNGVYIFKSTGGAITTGANSQVLLAGASAGCVFWAPVGLTTLGGASTFVGNILDAAGVTMGLGSVLNGRALAFGGTVTTNGAASITVPGTCAVTATPVEAGEVKISQFRFRGSAVAGDGARNEYVEIFNDKAVDVTVGVDGWAVSVVDPAGPSTSTIATIPAGTVLAAKRYYLIANNSASTGFTFGALNGYAAVATPVPTTVGSGNLQYAVDIPDGAGLALFKSALTLDSTTRLDSVGFSGVTDPLYKEGAGLTPPGGISVDGEYAFIRKTVNGVLMDTGDNASDFSFIATDGGTYSGRVAQLGAPGPRVESGGRPWGLPYSVVEPALSVYAAPNRVVDLTTTPKRLEFRYRVTNNTGQAITAIRWRFVSLTDLNAPGYSPTGRQADIRPVSGVSRTFGATSIGVTTVQALTLETPPSQAIGGGLHSTLVYALPGPLANGGTVDINIVFEIRKGGAYSFVTQVEAVP